jgi:hypothetical protein
MDDWRRNDAEGIHLRHFRASDDGKFPESDSGRKFPDTIAHR